MYCFVINLSVLVDVLVNVEIVDVLAVAVVTAVIDFEVLVGILIDTISIETMTVAKTIRAHGIKSK